MFQDQARRWPRVISRRRRRRSTTRPFNTPWIATRNVSTFTFYCSLFARSLLPLSPRFTTLKTRTPRLLRPPPHRFLPSPRSSPFRRRSAARERAIFSRRSRRLRLTDPFLSLESRGGRSDANAPWIARNGRSTRGYRSILSAFVPNDICPCRELTFFTFVVTETIEGTRCLSLFLLFFFFFLNEERTGWDPLFRAFIRRTLTNICRYL